MPSKSVAAGMVGGALGLVVGAASLLLPTRAYAAEASAPSGATDAPATPTPTPTPAPGASEGARGPALPLASPVPAAPVDPAAPAASSEAPPVPGSAPRLSTPDADEDENRASERGEASEGKAGLHVGLLPSVTLDYEHGHFYGFTNASLLWPLVSDAKLWAFSAGGGYTTPVSRGSRWKLDLFASGSPMVGNFDAPGNGWALGLGLGAGMHYESAGGILFAFKVPFIGSAAGKDISGGSGERVGIFYATQFATLPLVSLGLRL